MNHNLLKELKSEGLYRSLKVSKGLDFSSNDYLGLSKSSYLNENLVSFIKEDFHLWQSSSRLISGTTQIHIETEKMIADFLDRESSLIFTSGYLANLGVTSALCQNSLTFSDQLNHSSIIDGIRLSRSKCVIYPHRDYNYLDQVLSESTDVNLQKVIITESVFSMDGTIANISRLFEIAKKHDALLIVDEAHSTGLYGENGRGLCPAKCRDDNNLVTIHTGGKALGTSGAFVGCSETIKNILINKARSFIYSTALSPINTFTLNQAIEKVSQSEPLRVKLFKNIEYAQTKLKFLEDHEGTPILPILIPGNNEALSIAKLGDDKGIFIKAIRFPTVPKGSERIRLSIHADHSFNDIDRVADVINSCNIGII